jgi:hypothetical protein
MDPSINSPNTLFVSSQGLLGIKSESEGELDERERERERERTSMIRVE